jgi:hypothetical protein
MPSDSTPLLAKVSGSGGQIFSEKDLILTDFRGTEALSQLFNYELFLTAPPGKQVPFEKMLGQQVTVSLAREGGKKRLFHGLCNTLTEGLRGSAGTFYRATIVPEAWLLTRTVRSRVFEHKTVPDIVKDVLEEHGLKGKFTFQLQDPSKYVSHDYCTQYSESDFNFISRLLEEEGGDVLPGRRAARCPPPNLRRRCPVLTRTRTAWSAFVLVLLWGAINDLAVILDRAGSMADKTPEGTTKMEAAKKLVSDFIQDLPDGKRLTFIGYGHKLFGNDKQKGCGAVDVIVPHQGLNKSIKGQLVRSIAQLQPPLLARLSKGCHP